jgi:hypothetical protein
MLVVKTKRYGLISPLAKVPQLLISHTKIFYVNVNRFQISRYQSILSPLNIACCMIIPSLMYLVLLCPNKEEKSYCGAAVTMPFTIPTSSFERAP